LSNNILTSAKAAKKDEFYTQFNDIQNEINSYLDYDPNVFCNKSILLPCDDPEESNFTRFFAQNFDTLGLKRLISTSYSPESKKNIYGFQPDLFAEKDKQNQQKKNITNGKIFSLFSDLTGDGKINIDDLKWEFLRGDGDFRSKEVDDICKEVDIIITNPPFSLFREFFQWLIMKRKKFIIIGNINALTYREVFSSILKNEVWLGHGFKGGNASFAFPTQLKEEFEQLPQYDSTSGMIKFGNVCWLTNMEHGRRHQKLSLMTMKENLKFNKSIKNKNAYQKYLNYDAIEVPRVDAIPSDYEGIMGVPISFLEKHCPEQFEILGMCENKNLYGLRTKKFSPKERKEAYFKKHGTYLDKKGKEGSYDLNASGVLNIDGQLKVTYDRLLIKKVGL